MAQRSRSPAGWWLLVLLLTAAAAVPRAWPVAERALWFDEASTVHSAEKGLGAILRWEHHYEHPPLSYAAVWAAMRTLGGKDEWIVRLPSLLAGVACIPLLFLLGLRLGGPGLGLAAALLLAVDPLEVHQSQQARMYTLFLLVLVPTVLAFQVAVERSPRPRPSPWLWVGLGALLGLGLWTSLLALLVWPAFALALALCARSHPRPRALASGGALALLFAAALCHVGFLRLLSRAETGPPDPVPATPARALSQALRALGELFGAPPVSLLLLVAGALGLVLLLRRARPGRPARPAAILLLLLAGANLLALPSVRAVHHIVRPRYATVLELPVWIGVAALVTAPRRPALRLLAWGALLGVAAFLAASSVRSYVLRAPPRYATGEALRGLARDVLPSDDVAFVPGWQRKLGEYYGLRPRDRSCAGGRAFVFFGVDREIPEAVAAAGGELAELAARCGARLDAPAWRERLARVPGPVALVERGGAVSAIAPR